MNWQLSVTGLLIGALVGLTGMGGGSLMTPILILAFRFKPTLAVGTDILHGAVFKTFGAVRHRRLGTCMRITFWMFLASAPMSLLGVEVADWLEQHYGSDVESALAKVIGAALILGGLGFLAKTFVKQGVQPSDAPFLLADRDRVICIVLGGVGGFIVGLTSVGSGTFFGLVMLLVFPLTAAKIVGTDIFRRRPSVGGRDQAPPARERRPGRDGLAVAGVDPRRSAREQADGAAPTALSASGSVPS